MNLDRRLLRLAWQARLSLTLTVGLGFAAGVVIILQAGLLSRLITGIFLEGRDRTQAAGLLAALFLAIFLRAGINWAGDLAAASISAQIKSRLRLNLWDHLSAAGTLSRSGEHTGEKTAILIEGVEALDAYFSQYLPGLILAVLTPLTILIMVFPSDPISGAALLLTAPLIPVFMILIGGAAGTLTRRQWISLSRMSAYFLDVLQGLTTLKLLDRSRAQVKVIGQVSERFRQSTMAVLRVTFLSALALEMIATLSTAVVAVQVGLRLLYGQLTFEEAFFILLLAPEFYLPLRQLGARFHAGMSGAAAAGPIFEILERSADPSAGQHQEGQRAQASPAANLWREAVPKAIVFEDVSYTYSGDTPAVAGISLEIPAGQTVALVGRSGGGKSTLAALLLGFINPDRGQITIGGQSLEKISSSDWHRQIAWISQQPHLFNASILENILAARPDATREQVEQASRLAEAHDFIRSLPLGYDTPVGESGTRLSGGQAQRIALARAFLRDAPYIILDEPTANLDLESEAKLQRSLERLLVGRTALVIAHRLNTVRRADRIYLIDHGQRIAAGTHPDLLISNRLYQRLVEAYSGGTKEKPVQFGVEEETASPALPLPRGSSRLGFTSVLPSSAPALSPIVLASKAGSTWTTFARLVTLLLPFWPGVILSALAGAATVLSGVGLMSASAYIISAAALQSSIAELQVAIVGVRFFGISRGLFRYLERYLTHDTTFRLLARLRVWFYAQLEPLAPARLFYKRSGDLLARIIGDIETLENFYVRVAAPPLSAILVGSAVWALLVGFDARIGLTWLGLWLTAGIGIPLMAHRLGKKPGREAVEARAELSAAAAEGIQSMPELMVYGLQDTWRKRIEASGMRLSAAGRSLAGLSGLQNALNGLLANLAVWIVVYTAIPQVQAGDLSGVYLAALALAALTSFESVAPLPLAAQFLESSLQAAGRLFEVVDAQAEVIDPPAPLPAPVVIDGKEPGANRLDIAVTNLSFIYPISEKEPLMPPLPALANIDLELPQGKWAAIVGPSGAGKSTLLSLILRFWTYSEGKIMLNGEDLSRYAQRDIRRMIGVIPQRTYLFSASIRDNIRLARPEASMDDIIQAAQQAEIQTLIEQLPNGYDTWIGEGGRRLSGGERQRIAIARTLLKNAPLVLLDEPTNGLDPITERQVLDAIFSAVRGRSLLWATHRLIGMERMDEIVVLNQGRIEARGRHVDLLERPGVYRRLWDLQHSLLNDSA